MASCAVIGLGKLGACLAAVLSDAGHRVFGIDTNADTVAKINAGEAPVREAMLDKLIAKSPFQASTDYSNVRGTDIAFIVLPTPSREEDDTFDDTLVREAVAKVAAEYEQGGPDVIVVCSTVMPGTCVDIAAGLRDELHLVYSPEFIAIGSVIADMRCPDLVLIGEDPDFEKTEDHGAYTTFEVLSTIWTNEPEVAFLPWTDAELAKISVNAYVTMKISFANSLTAIAEGYGASARAITTAIGSDSRIGTKYLHPGTGFGGPCFPRDSRAFGEAARRVGVSAGLARETDRENIRALFRMYDWCPERGAIAILGLSYKPGTYLTEESAGVKLAEILLNSGHPVHTYDPMAEITIHGETGWSVPLDNLEAANQCAAVVIATPWDQFRNFEARVPTLDCWAILSKRNEFVKVWGEA